MWAHLRNLTSPIEAKEIVLLAAGSAIVRAICHVGDLQTEGNNHRSEHNTSFIVYRVCLCVSGNDIQLSISLIVFIFILDYIWVFALVK